MGSFSLGGKESDFDSKKSRGKLVNLIAEADNSQQYRTIKRCDGLKSFGVGSGPIRSNQLVNGDYTYLISGTQLFRCDTNGNDFDLGTVGGIGQGQILANAVPGNNQICVLNGSGDGYIYDNSGLTQITDSDFFPTTSGTVLNERFWFVRDGTNEFFGSDVSDGFSYNPLTFASAEESPDFCISIIAKKSSLWVLGSKTVEFWQSFDDIILPIRKVRSSTIERGIKAKSSLAEMGEYFAFFADDMSVRLVAGNEIKTISDLEFELKVRGNGTLTNPGFTRVDDAIGFWVDGPTHKIYYLTFPEEGYTWGYDLKTGLTHTRKSEGLNYWRAMYSVIFGSKVLIGDYTSADIWELDPATMNEGGDTLKATIRTPGVSFDHDVTIPLIEIDMEVGQISDPSTESMMMVRYSKDGGYNWTNHSNVSLGTKGNYRKRVPLRQFGRLVRYKDFQLELSVTDETRVQFYGADMPMGQSI